MILSKSRVNKLLEIFENPKSIMPYDNTKEKEEMVNATKFINDYHLYGPPPTIYSSKTKPVSSNGQISKQISRKTSINSKNSSIQKKSIINKSQKLTNYEDLEIKQSLTNLRLGQKQYNLQNQTKSLKKDIIQQNNGYYQAYNPYTQSTELLKNQTLFNSILNSSNLTSTQYLYGYSTYSNKPYNHKTLRTLKSTRLSDIPSNPDDVIIKELPPGFTISMNPISNSNMGMSNMNNMNIGQNTMEMNPPEINEPPQMIEEINTDIIPNDDNQPNQQEEIPLEENHEELNKEEPEPQPEEVAPVQTTGKYQITEFNGPVKVPPGYSTDDEDEFNAIQFLNEDLSQWKLQIDKPNCKVYSKIYKVKNEKGEENDNVMFYMDATIDFPASEVNRQLNTYELREKWEKSLEKGKLIKQEDLGNGIKITDYYAYLKMPFIFADRDMVIRKKVWENYQGEKDCYLMQLHSIEHPDYPEKEKPVRATFDNRGKYIKPINDNQCKFYLASKFDMKLSVSASMMEGKGSEGTEKWLKEFIKHCGK